MAPFIGCVDVVRGHDFFVDEPGFAGCLALSLTRSRSQLVFVTTGGAQVGG